MQLAYYLNVVFWETQQVNRESQLYITIPMKYYIFWKCCQILLPLSNCFHYMLAQEHIHMQI